MQDGPDTPSQVLALLAMLTERYPATFRHEGEPPRPLAIGITERLITELRPRPAVVTPPCGSIPGATPIRHALREPGAMRVDLDGHEVEPVARSTRPSHAPHAPAAQHRRPRPSRTRRL